MSKNKKVNKIKFSKILPILMIIFGCLMIICWVPVWIWFVIIGAGLIFLGFNIYN